MGRKPSFDSKLSDRVAELQSTGMTTEAIRVRLGAEGFTVPSKGTVDNIRGAVKPSPKVEKPKPATDIESIRALIPKLSKVIDRALEDDEITIVNGVSRTMSTLTTLVSKLEPPVLSDPNEQPDMVDAAARFRDKMHKLWDKMQ